MRFALFINCVLFSLFSSLAIAEPLSRDQVPDLLQPWVDWVLEDEDQIDCPYLHNQPEQACVWPSTLELVLTDNGGSFSQMWQVYGRAMVQLPGAALQWPQNVRSESGDLLVHSIDGLPYVELEKGLHTINGQFHWQALPKSLKVTPESGLISLSLNGQVIEQAQFNRHGQLWLNQGDVEAASKDDLDIQVFRKLIDSHPVKINTMIKLRVSGKQRNTTLNSAMLEGFIGLQIHSELPARLNRENELELQLRPGEWVIEVIARAPSDITEFIIPENQVPWPSREIWVYEADTMIRQAKVIGPSSIDPSQTQLPAEWKFLPTYILSNNESLALDVSHRGAVDVGHDELSLKRQLWLDYDGKGYTVKDTLNGTLTNPERLDVLPELELGRVSIDGEPQFITRGDTSDLIGVEVRKAKLSLVAESRYTGTAPPVNGWQHDLSDVSTTLHLPPGWRLFAANGTDNVPDSWLQVWSLLDLFLVLIIAISVAYLYGILWAAFTLLCLILVWHEPNAPRFIWLNLLALVAMLRVLPVGRLRQVLQVSWVISLVVLLLIILPYTIDTIRLSLYPQLEVNHYRQHEFGMKQSEFDNQNYSNVPLQDEVAVEMLSSSKMIGAESYSKSNSKYASTSPRPNNLTAIDPNSKIQTGFGLPTWTGRESIDLYWSGPVKADETSRLILLGPTANFVIRISGIVLLLVLSWRVSSLGREAWSKGSMTFKSLLPSLLALSLLPLLLTNPSTALAESIPNELMLEDLHSRLTAEPDCLPDCAQIESMQLTIAEGALTIRLRVHSATNTAIPLPGKQGLWLPDSILLGSKRADAVQRDSSQNIWVALDAGLHDIILQGPLAKRNSIALPLPLKPHYIEWRSLDSNWTLEGVDNNNAHDSQLQINRVAQAGDLQGVATGDSLLPVFVKVERLITLGLDWNVTTTVTRLAPYDSPIGLSIPLLEGEQVMSAGNGVAGGSINVAMSSRQKEFSWSSRLAINASLNLKAASDNNYLESWQLSVSPIWHIEGEGIPYNETSATNHLGATTWQPWPGESLQLHVTRPEGVEGQSVTILSSQVSVSPGKRANDVELTMNILSSRGVSHDISLPDDVTVQSLMVDDIAQQVSQQNNSLKLPLVPGNQTVQVRWRDEQALTTRFDFPKVDLSIPSVNSWFKIKPASSRWVVWVDGPVSGPAVLIWGVLLTLFILAIALAKSKLTPLKTWQWFLLGVGLSQTETILMVIVIAWLVAIAMREKYNKSLLVWQFNVMQSALVFLSIVALGVLAVAVGNGLLGSPDMQIVGNGSYSSMLSWYQDRSDRVLAQPLVISVPMWIYRTLMLFWALWLAKSVISWLRWEWGALNVGGLWKKKALVV